MFVTPDEYNFSSPCRAAKAALSGAGVPRDHPKYKIYELDEMDADEASNIQSALGRLTGASTVPRVFVRGTFIGGGDDTTALYLSGKLKEMVTEALK